MSDHIISMYIDDFKVFLNTKTNCLYVYFKNIYYGYYGGNNSEITDDIDILIEGPILNGIEIRNISTQKKIKYPTICNKSFQKNIKPLIDFANKLIEDGTITKLMVFI